MMSSSRLAISLMMIGATVFVCVDAAAAPRSKLEPHVSQYFGVAVHRTADGLIETQTLSVSRSSDRKGQYVLVAAPEACPLGSYTDPNLSIRVGLAKREATQVECKTDQEWMRMQSQLGAAISANAERFSNVLSTVVSPEQLQTIGLGIDIRLERNDVAFRYQLSGSARAAIELTLVVPVTNIGEMDDKAIKRLLLELLAAATHEYVHGVAMLDGRSSKVSTVGDESVASIVEYVVGLLSAGCTASGEIELMDGKQIELPVDYSVHRKLIKHANGNPAIEGYIRAMLNLANATRSTTYSAAAPLDRAKLVLTARNALAFSSDLGIAPLEPIPDDAMSAYIDSLGCEQVPVL